MPRINPHRRRDLTDAAIELLASSGVHGLTHRAVEKAAELPPGTASNYFRSREALLVGTAERITELHLADMDRAARQYRKGGGDAGQRAGDHLPELATQVIDLLAESLWGAVTTYRVRYLAIFELQLEARRRPALAAALAALLENSVRFTAGHHAQLGLPIPTDKIPILITLYQGALFALITAPPEHITQWTVHSVAHAIVHGALPDWNCA
jgi:AcrR family transcriptional regulator